jgi:hypothetical protein
VMPATRKYFAFMDTSGARDLTPTAAVDASKCDVATKMPPHGVSPATQGRIRHRLLDHVTPALHICGVRFAYD